MKVLAVLWDIYGEIFSIPGIYNKRQILTETSEVFDPLGYFSPVLSNAKLLLTNICQNDLH